MIDKNFLTYMYNHTEDVDMCGFHKKIVSELQKLESGNTKRLAIFLPPRFGKTLIATLFSAWYLEMNPSDDVIYASYSQDRSNDALKVVATANQSLILNNDLPLIGKNNGEGSLYPMGVRSFVGDRGANLIVMDDLIKNNQEATSEENRLQKEHWFINGMYPRLYSGGKMLLIGSRWNNDDINNFILRITEPDDWTILSFPAITNGKSIFEKRYPLKRLNAMKKKMSSDAWEYLYQQGASLPEKFICEDEELYAELKKLALKNEISLEKLIGQILRFHYQQKGKNNAA